MTTRQTWFTILLTSLLAVLIATNCTSRQDEPPQDTPVPPSMLQDLPRTAKIRCSDNLDHDLPGVAVWEFPGIKPPDPNSAYQGHKGKRLGILESCAEVMMTDCAWSEFDHEFWIYIETEGLKGWIPWGYFDLSP